jgi:hypothetical protein
VGLGFPKVAIAEAKSLPVGTKVFVEGVALTAYGVFGDTTTHVAGLSAAIRAVRVQRVTQLVGDSVRLAGTVASREGQPVLDDVRVFVLAFDRPIPPVSVLATGLAAVADGGRLDAALVSVLNVSIVDTATTSTGFAVSGDDGSGAVEILLDADISFDETGLIPGAAIDATGVLVPDGGGAWRLKPRGRADLVLR